MSTLLGQADDDINNKADPAKHQTTPGAENLVTPTTNNNTVRIDQQSSAPGRRLYNPLGEFASYTYQLTLYMITPDAYDAFVQSGRRNINVLNNASNTGSGAYVIAQSGGINDRNTQRAPGFKYDYYIDNLSITTLCNPAASQTATNTTEIKFDVLEPYSFRFLSELRRASDALSQYSKALGNEKLKNPTRNFFILGVRFYGYDINGKLVTEVPNYDGTPLDPVNATNGLFETFYDIVITEIKFKLDGKNTTYNVTAVAPSPQSAFGAKRGVLNNASPIQAATVKDALVGPDGLLTRMNKEQDGMLSAGKISEKNSYQVVFLGDSASIEFASIVSSSDLDKYRWPSGPAKTATEVNDATAAQSVPNPAKRTITFAAGTPVLMAIQQIITQSSYLEDALKIVYTTNLEPVPGKNDQAASKSNENVRVRWYNLSSEISNARWDDTIGDFAYDIKYVIQPYETPVVRNAYVNPGIAYYGPHKRYEYWLTGKNTEVIKYEQTFDNLFYLAVLDNPNIKKADLESQKVEQGGPANIPSAPGQRQPMQRLGRLNVGLEAQNAYITNLYSPADWAEAKITIFGDPDYLMKESASSQNALYDKFYGPDGFTVNPNGGQVFIELDFKEAEDFNTTTGLLDINESIQLWKYPENFRKIVKGISFMLLSVDSKFSNGQFTQVLHCRLNTFGGALENKENQRPDERSENNTAGPTPNGNATTSSTGLRQEPNSPTAEAIVSPSATAPTNNTPTEGTVQTNSGPVADDDLAPVTVTAKRVPIEQQSRLSFDGTTWYDESGREIPVDDVGRPLA